MLCTMIESAANGTTRVSEFLSSSMLMSAQREIGGSLKATLPW